MTRILLLCGVASALLSGGCASTSADRSRASTPSTVCDADFVARVEREAKRHGSAIRWYRCPQFAAHGGSAVILLRRMARRVTRPGRPWQ